MSKITGHHHISMYTKNIDDNKAFYLDVLGLKLVKETVNQDDNDMVHIFYGDNKSTPGTLLTFFELPLAGMMRKGTNMIARIGLLVRNSEALDYFEKRLQDKAHHIERGTYMHQDALYFDDPESLSFVMIANDDYTLPQEWGNPTASDIPEEYQILGMGPIEIHVKDIDSTLNYLSKHIDYHERSNMDEHTFTLVDDGLYSDIVVIQKDGPNVRPGRGYVHHHAIATTKEALPKIIEKHDHLPGRHSGLIDRKWFESLYYRQNHIMFEFATVEPGFE